MIIKGNLISIKDPKHILVIQLGDIGDVVMALPALQALRHNFPKANIEVAVREKAALLLEGCTGVDLVLSVDKYKKRSSAFAHQAALLSHIALKRFDMAIELRTGTRGAFLSFLSGARHRIGRYSAGDFLRNKIFTHLVNPENEINQYSVEHNLNILKPLSLIPTSKEPCLNIPQKIIQRVYGLIQQQMPISKKIIVLHPFSIWNYKELAEEQYIRLIQHIKSNHDCNLIITGSKEERLRAAMIIDKANQEVFNFAGKTSIIEMAGLLKLATLLISIDTSAIHIAAAVKTPTITIFGPSSMVNWAPRGKEHVTISNTMECIPCRKKGCNNSLLTPCLTTLSPDDISKTIDTHLKNIEKRKTLDKKPL